MQICVTQLKPNPSDVFHINASLISLRVLAHIVRAIIYYHILIDTSLKT